MPFQVNIPLFVIPVISTSANTFILCSSKLAATLAFVKYLFEPSAKLDVVKFDNVLTVPVTLPINELVTARLPVVIFDAVRLITVKPVCALPVTFWPPMYNDCALR